MRLLFLSFIQPGPNQRGRERETPSLQKAIASSGSLEKLLEGRTEASRPGETRKII